jgi:uncharacterized protein
MLCIHHNDLDGRAAGAIVKRRFPDVRLVEADYTRFPMEEIKRGEALFIVDYSPQPANLWPEVLERAGGASCVTWIDHHETALIASEQVKVEGLPGKRSIEGCGALLTWLYLFPEEPAPSVLGLVDKWDRWVHEDNEDVLCFVAGMKIWDKGAGAHIWQWLLEDSEGARKQVAEIQGDGAVVRAYEVVDNQGLVDSYAYPVRLNGYRCLALNSNRRNSKVFDSVPVGDRPDIFIAYQHTGTQFIVSLYSTTVKVNDVAKMHGGGGHTGAAGFVCERLPW